MSQPEGSTEQPNPQVPDITSSPRPGPTASPSPSLPHSMLGSGERKGASPAQKRPPHTPTHQGLGPNPGMGSASGPTHMLGLLTRKPGLRLPPTGHI